MTDASVVRQGRRGKHPLAAAAAQVAKLHKSAVMSSTKHDWQTPDHILDAVRMVAPIGLDPCTTESNPTGARVFYSVDGLAEDWGGKGLTFVNPPYGREVGKWLAKCPTADSCIALPASRTDTKWFHNALTTADVLCLIKGRLRFKGAPASAPFPSVAIGWAPEPISSRRDPWKCEYTEWFARFFKAFGPLGKVIHL